MAVDIEYLATRGVSSGAYKELFTAEKPSPLIRKLTSTIQQRVYDGRQSNLREYKTYWAIDLAFETPFAQTTPTLVNALLQRNLKADELMKELETYGLSEKELFLSVDLGNGITKKIINPPIFYQILIPVVRAYHTIRTARIYNERDKSPLLKYRPANQTDGDRVKCEIITEVVDKCAQALGWSEYLKTAIQMQLKYGVALSFPKEEWYVEKQVIGGKAKVQKEGLRYDFPHPTRMGWDLSHPLPTINTDSGVEYAWHWSVTRAGEVLDNRMYWNRKAISFGTNWMDQPLYRNYFNEVYPCQLKFPQVNDPTLRREDKAAYYGTAERDAAMFLTEFFWKLVPSRWGLAPYKYPVWHRFTVAGDATIIWAAPCAYNPMWFMGFDFDAQAGQPSSFALECIPWQDHLGNLLSQMVLTAKQNLVNINWYDKQMVDKKDIEGLENLGERKYRSLNFVGFDSMKLTRAGLDPRQAFVSHQFQFRSIVELQSMLSTALSIMERVLQITAQETGAAGPHYQSKEEIVRTAGNSENRINYTASSTDAGIDAWKQQAYEANMAYRDDDVTAHVSNDIQDLEKHVEELGFKITGNGPRKKLVGGQKSKLNYAEFSRSNVSPEDDPDPQMSQVLFQTLQIISQKPEFVQAIGVARILKLIEQAAKLAGAPQDFDITSVAEDAGNDPSQIMAQLQPVLAQLQQNIIQTVTEKFVAPAAKKVGEQQQELDQLAQIVQKFEGIFKAAEAMQQKTAIKAAETQQQMQIDAAKFQAEEARKQQSHEAELQRMAQKAAIEGQVAATTAAIQVQAAKEKADVDSAVRVEDAKGKVAVAEAVTESKIKLAEKTTEAKIEAAKAVAKASAKAKKNQPKPA